MESITRKHVQPWWLMHLHNGCYVLMGIVLMIHPLQASLLYTGLLGGLLLLAGLSTADMSRRLHNSGQANTTWLILSSIRNGLFGLTLLVTMGSPLSTMVNILGLWGLVYAFLQAIEALFYFLGTRVSQDKDYWVEVIHFFCVLVSGGFAYVLIMLPNSLGMAALFLIGLGIIQVVLTYRLQASADNAVG
ncbi:DUF308 domain-containing protein [Spirosoma spitsbergense]|jgi:uncharacterized membrane protein HdeD (DUF308 family)|uniref:DUF308 domain-containing protein n=1 Tax=Spirosoma spitsbergense TaxID=431554 RepID=UPI0003A91749|nr:DUF308 domain-containing protein [Spirosoma spitsbergense]